MGHRTRRGDGVPLAGADVLLRPTKRRGDLLAGEAVHSLGKLTLRHGPHAAEYHHVGVWYYVHSNKSRSR